ncbi:MAG TPA: metal ABC transporter ATP-binding protein [Thermoanaerobaculia bacterium]|jgi:zinc transport system ATP-binding protein|nr:metal ABC transporter ATP-binding protein [Thermoanaerobaculia bacterium]
MSAILELKNVSVTLDHDTIVRGVSFVIEDGQSIAIIGPNGSGKTVLLKAILGLIAYDGEIIWRPGATVGYVPQKIDADRSVPLNVRNLLVSKAHVIGKGEAEITQVIQRVGLSEPVLATPIGHLSGGQFQRALVAFALLGDPDIVLFDEPTASMDEPGEEQLYALLDRLRTEVGITTVVVSHDLSFVYRHADNVLCLNRSGVCFGPPRGVLTSKLLAELFDAPTFYGHTHS